MRTKLLLVVLIIASALIASDARQDAFGFGSKYVADPNDVIYNPALSLDWANLAQLEFGTYAGSGFTPSGQWGMAALSLGENLSVGAALRRCDGDVFWISESYPSASGILVPNPGINLWGAYGIGDIKLGLGIYKASNSEEVTNDNDTSSFESSSGIFAVSLGAGLPVFKQTEVAFSFAMNSISTKEKNSANQERTFDLTGGSEIGLSVRSFVPVQDIFEVVPVIGFSTFSYSMESVNFAGTKVTMGDWSRMIIAAGVGINTEIVENGIISVGIGMDMMNFKDEIDTTDKSEDKILVLPEVSVSAEIPVKDWVSVRAGMGKMFMSSTHIEDKIETTIKEAESNASFLTLGAGFKFNMIKFDVSISEDKLFEGTYLLSGITDNLAVKASLGIEW